MSWLSNTYNFLSGAGYRKGRQEIEAAEQGALEMQERYLQAQRTSQIEQAMREEAISRMNEKVDEERKRIMAAENSAAAEEAMYRADYYSTVLTGGLDALGRPKMKTRGRYFLGGNNG